MAIITLVQRHPHGKRMALALQKLMYTHLHQLQSIRASSAKQSCIVASQVRSATEPLKVILESQFRPSQGNYVIEVRTWPGIVVLLLFAYRVGLSVACMLGAAHILCLCSCLPGSLTREKRRRRQPCGS